VAEIGHLKARLKQYNDYDEIKRELEILKVYLLSFFCPLVVDGCHKYVEFSGFDEDAEGNGSQVNGYVAGAYSPVTTKSGPPQSKSLEALLATKNKRITEELTKFRVSVPP
jgi:homeobox protein cut-like